MRSILNNCISNLKKAIAEQSALIAGLTRCGLLVQVDIGKKYHLHATCAEAVRSTQLTKSIPKSAQRQSVGTPASSVASSTEKMSHENNNQTGKKSVTSEFAYRWLKTLAHMISTKKKKKEEKWNRSKRVVVTWCFMPSQPVQLYQGEEEETDNQICLSWLSHMTWF